MVPAHDRSSIDQASALRQLAGEGGCRATTLAILSGKGGVGKTTVAVNLAVALAGKGLRVVLVDLDFGLANADLLMNLHSTRSLAHLISGTHTIEEVLVQGPSGIQVIPGASGGLRQHDDLTEFQRRQLLQQMGGLEAKFDYIIMDLGAGISANVLTFACAADLTLVVTTPEPTALADAYAAIKMIFMDHKATDIELLVNQARTKKEARLAYERLAAVAGRFLGLPITFCGYVLADEAVGWAVRSRKPLLMVAPRSNAGACLRAVANRYARHSRFMPQAGFFQRVAQMFR